jgi:hypothetical protein
MGEGEREEVAARRVAVQDAAQEAAQHFLSPHHGKDRRSSAANLSRCKIFVVARATRISK